MKYLLDTHTFIWSLAQSTLIPERARQELRNPGNEVFISAVNLWEISIKTRIQKIDLGGVAIGDLIALAEETGFQLIGLSPEEAIAYGSLEEDSHFDPFDRMLIWQAIRRNLTMVSRDSEFGKFVPYGLALLWK
ncbi:MAG: type II toxin-antitoxin system VapC family toxin [Spirochaeta sp.]|jgi:PIN domain nuclease of toxin-antitoxin system|nr:type II toxin-antitoxin system VapC family toxin [Spirochaeta sp.]